MTAARRRVLRWGLRALVLAVLVVLITVDARMKGGPRIGFAPANANWVAYAPQFSGVWTGLTRTAAFRDFVKQWPAPYNNAQLQVRLTAGIRPTPLRWSTWLGKKAVVFGTDEGVGWCVRPGLLLRAGHAINAALTTGSEKGNFRYGPYHYAWRDGFVIFSKSPEVLEATRNGAEFKAAEAIDGDEWYVVWQASPKGFVVLSAREGLPVRGKVEIPLRGSGTETLPWPENPFLEVNSTDCGLSEESVGFLRWCFSLPPPSFRLAKVLPGFQPTLADAKSPGAIAESDFALFEPIEGEPKVPGAALRLRVYHEIPSAMHVATGDDPLAGWGVCGTVSYIATSKKLLDALLSQTKVENGTPRTAVARVDWERAGKAFEKHLRAVLEEDDTLRESIEGTGIPATQALAALGKLHIEGHRENGKLRLEGRLAQSVEKPTPQQTRISAKR